MDRVGVRQGFRTEAPLAVDRLTGSDKRILALWIVCGIVGALFAHKYFFRAFPEASVDFKVSRKDAQSRAKQFVEGLGENLSGYQSTIVFSVDENAKTYLERELGLQQANHLMSSEVSIWYWDVRFFRPQQLEEFVVGVSPGGEIVGYDHKIEEARAAKSLDREQALTVAESFAGAKLGENLSQWDFLQAETNSETRPNRVDWSFTWERKGFKAKEAPYRLRIGLQGDHIGDSQEFLQVPQAWTRDYQHLRSTNIFYNQIALIPYGFLLGGALWLGIALTRQGKTSWGAALKIGVVVAILYFLMQLNDWGSVRAEYDTHFTYASFVLRSLLQMFLAAVGTALTVSLVLPGGEPLYREAQPERLRLTRAFSMRGIRSKEFFCSSVVGLSLAAAHIGFIVAFYMVGSRFGVWAPQDLSYSDVVNTSFPWIAGVTIGVLAATSEEFLFRLFAIPFLHKLTGSRVLAVILPAFFWSFLHSAYPQEPGYIRGIEVGLIGIVAGLVMLRWGIVATLIWHYTVDASLVGLLLIRSGNLYFKVSGIVVGLAALAPLLFSGVLYLTRGRFEDVEDLLNRAEPAPQISLARESPVEHATVSARRYEPLTTSALGFLAVCVVIGGFMALRLKREHIGDYLKVSVNRTEATQCADAVMREHGLDPNSYRKAAQMADTTNPVVNEFLRRRMSISKINEIYDESVPGALWRVRFFRDSQPEEFAVTLKPDGNLHGFWHTLAEATKGANLSKDEAAAIAEKYLLEKKQIDLSGWKLVEANSDKRPNRTDHTLIWQQNAPLDPQSSAVKDSTNHAYKRMSLQVLGDEPADYRTFIKIPEEFERKESEQTVVRILVTAGQLCLVLGLIVSVLVFFFKRMKVQPAVTVPWRRFVGWGLVGLAAYLLSLILGRGLPAILANYPTTMPLRLYFGTVGIFFLLSSAFLMGVITLLFGLAWSFGVRGFGEAQLPGWFGMPANYYRDAFWIGVGGSALLVGLRRLIDFVSVWWPTLHRDMPSSFSDSFDAVFPGIGVIGGAVLHGLLFSGVLFLGGAFLGTELRVRWLRLVLFLAVAAALVTSWGTPADFLKQFLASGILLAVVVFGIRRLVRFNLLGLFLIVTCTGLLVGAIELISQPNAFYRTNGYVILLALVLLLAWPLITWRLRGQEAASQ
jgi:membrane protease YdiL (CAAX protease family)